MGPVSILRPCIDCGKLTKRSRCPEHTTAAALTRQQPWQKLYKTGEWRRAQREVRIRDGLRCTWSSSTGRCKSTSDNSLLSVHHIVKLQDLWEAANGEWKLFLRAACNPDNLATLCSRHHHQADRRSHARQYA